MKKLTIILFFCLSLICSPSQAALCPNDSLLSRSAGLQDSYVAVFTSEEFVDQWEAYEPDYKFVYKSWKDFPVFLDNVKKKAGNRKLVIDIDVHGGLDGFYTSRKEVIDLDTYPIVQLLLEKSNLIYYSYEKASMGYVYTNLEKRFSHRKNLTVLCEACYAGNNYYTIRKNKISINEPYVVDYPHYPDIPIYCTGSGFSNPDITMYMQHRFNYHKWWVDIRKYECELTPDNPEPTIEGFPEGFSYTTMQLVSFSTAVRENLQ